MRSLFSFSCTLLSWSIFPSRSFSRCKTIVRTFFMSSHEKFFQACMSSKYIHHETRGVIKNRNLSTRFHFQGKSFSSEFGNPGESQSARRVTHYTRPVKDQPRLPNVRNTGKELAVVSPTSLSPVSRRQKTNTRKHTKRSMNTSHLTNLMVKNVPRVKPIEVVNVLSLV